MLFRTVLTGYLLVLFTAYAATAHPSPDSVVSAYEAPDFELPGIDGLPVRLSDHRGKIVALNFWATWCMPCRHEVPAFVRLQHEFRDDVQFIGVSLDEQGKEGVVSFAEEYDVNYPIVIDDGSVAPQYGNAEVLPTTFLIDRSGNVVVYAPGMLEEGDMREILTMILDGEIR